MPLQEKPEKPAKPQKPALEKKNPAPKGGIVYSEPARQIEHRTSLEGWSPERVKVALTAADNGNLTELSDLCDVMLADDRIAGVLAQRTHGLLGLPRAFVGGSDEVCGVLEGPPGPIPGEFDTMCPEEELIGALSMGLMLGVVPVQLVPLPRTQEQKQRYRIEVWSPRWLTYYQRPVDGAHWYIQTLKGREKIIPGAGRWALFTPYGPSKPWLRGKWRELSFPWLLKRYALEDRANHSETVGSPTKVGKTSKGSTEGHRQRFKSQIAALAKRGTLILPEGYDYEIVESSGQTSQIYAESVSWADGALTISIAGQIVTTEGQSGFSEGKIFDSIVGDFIRFDARRLSAWLHEQIFKPFCRANYDVHDTPYLFYNTEKPTDLEVQSRTWQQVGASIKALNENLAGSGKSVDVIAVCKQYNIPLKEGEPPKPEPAVNPLTGEPLAPPGEMPPGEDKKAPPGKEDKKDPGLSQEDSVPTDKED